jgi:ABC-type transporter Mla maintaining outer membrane lipid asymmetry ATPase subunit MlaF
MSTSIPLPTANDRTTMTLAADATTTASHPRIQADDVSRSIRGRTLVDQVSLAVEAGEMVALIGGSGAGKTSLLETLVGLHVPTSGSVPCRRGGRGA